MENLPGPAPVANQSTEQPKKLKACCACKPTKKMRDECIFNYGQERCTDFIEAHNSCLREKGFKVVETYTSPQ